MTVWFVTGASAGFGAEIVRTGPSTGRSGVATARNPKAVLAESRTPGTRCSSEPLERGRPGQHRRRWTRRFRRVRPVDVLVNNAGGVCRRGGGGLRRGGPRGVRDERVRPAGGEGRAVLPVMRSAAVRAGVQPQLGRRHPVGRAGACTAAPSTPSRGLSERCGWSSRRSHPGHHRRAGRVPTDFLDGSSLHHTARSSATTSRPPGRRATSPRSATTRRWPTRSRVPGDRGPGPGRAAAAAPAARLPTA